MQEFFSWMTSLEGWSYYSPDDCVVELSSDDQVYGTVYSSCDMYEFDVILHQLWEIENEKVFESENNVPFSSLITLDKHDWSHGYLAKASGTAAQPSAGSNSDVITSQHLMDAGDCDFDGAGDNVFATRISD